MSHINDSTAARRIREILDQDSFVEIGAYVTARSTDFGAASEEATSDGVVTGYGTSMVNSYTSTRRIRIFSEALSERCMRRRFAGLYGLAVKMGAPVNRAHRLRRCASGGSNGCAVCVRHALSGTGTGKRRGSADSGCLRTLRRKPFGQCGTGGFHLHGEGCKTLFPCAECNLRQHRGRTRHSIGRVPE